MRTMIIDELSYFRTGGTFVVIDELALVAVFVSVESTNKIDKQSKNWIEFTDFWNKTSIWNWVLVQYHRFK